MSSDDLRARMRAVFSTRLSKSEKPVLRCHSVDSAAENSVTDASICNTVFPNEDKTITPAHRFAANKAGLRENTLCSVCGAGGDLWTLDTPAGPALVHQECARLLARPEAVEQSAAYQATSAEPDGTACRITIIEIPAKGLRFRRTFAHLQLKPPALVDVTRWRQCVEDGKRFLAKWGEQAQALNWSSADLFGLHAVPERPHQSYRRLSRYDCTGLCWLLEGRPVLALTADTAAVENPIGNISTYRRFSKPSYGPLGDSLEDLQ
jgi:hypothetical protein